MRARRAPGGGAGGATGLTGADGLVPSQEAVMTPLRLLPALVIAGCGLGDGVPLSELDADDWQSLCEDVPRGRTVQCETEASSVEVTTDGPEQCAAVRGVGTVGLGCEATVGDWRACVADLDEDPCLKLADDPGQACSDLRTCVTL